MSLLLYWYGSSVLSNYTNSPFFGHSCFVQVNGEMFFLCHSKDQLAIAQALEKVPGLSLEDRYTFTNAPIPGRIKEIGKNI